MAKDKFYAITSVGKIIESDLWETLMEKANSHYEIEMYVAFYFDKPHTTSFGNGYYWPKIQILDINQKPTTYARGAFKIKRIYEDKGFSYFLGREMEIENLVTGEMTRYHVRKNEDISHMSIEHFYYGILDVLDELNRIFSQQIIK